MEKEESKRKISGVLPMSCAAGGGVKPGAYDKVITAVRARPLNSNDGSNARDIIRYFGDQKNGLGIVDPTNHDAGTERMFQFDHTYWSVDRSKTEFYAGQEEVYNSIGMPILETCLKGVNCSLFAYGQTGSGKTYTMMGGDPSSEDAGVIPRLCRQLLQKLEQEKNKPPPAAQESEQIVKTEVCISYVEIYNEKVFDLLSQTPGSACRVREHPETGAYVENITMGIVVTYKDVEVILKEGGGKRHVAATLMNSESSRSHAVFTLHITQHLASGRETAKADVVRKSKVSLVDLAGSERMSTTGASGDRLREASNINRSLSVLGDVIKALSEKSRLGNSSRNHDFVPYRNSILTWLLKDSLGGNSRTTMLATVSPTDSSYNESINTLRYIERTKLIVNAVSVNVTRSENARVNNLLKQISDLEMKYEELQNHQIEREQQHRDDVEKMQSEFELHFTEQLKVLAGELERHYAQQAQTQIAASPVKRGLSFTEATSFDCSCDKSGASGTVHPDAVLFGDKDEVIKKYGDIIKEKDQVIASYEKVLSTNRADGDSMLSSLEAMISTLKDQLEVANSRYDMLSDRYRVFSHEVDTERKEMSELYTNNQEMIAEITKIKLNTAKKDRELQDRVKDNELLKNEVDRLRLSLRTTQQEHNKIVENLEEYIQDLSAQKEQLSELENQLDIEKYGNALKAAMVQDLHVKLAQEQTASTAKINNLTHNLDLRNMEVEQLSRDHDDKVMELQQLVKELKLEITSLESRNENNKLTLQDVLETARSNQENALVAKDTELAEVSNKFYTVSHKLDCVTEEFDAFKKASLLQWDPVLLSLRTLADEAKRLKKCLKTTNIDDVIPFLEETRRCYKGSDISDETLRTEVVSNLSSVYSTFRDVAMAWMKSSVGADKDYDYKDLAEALVLAKVEIAQNHYELENLNYLMKNGEKNRNRGIASVWGSIGSRGRSFLYEKDKNDKVIDEEEDSSCGFEIDAVATGSCASANSTEVFYGGDDHRPEAGCDVTSPAEQVENTPEKSASRRWNLWSQLGSKSGSAN